MSKELREIIEKYEEEIIRIHKGWMEHRLLFTEMSDKLSELKNQAIQQIKQFARDEWVLSVEKIEKILYELANNQLRGVIKVVDKKGLMNTGWDDIESEGGALDFSIIAEAINSKMREEIEKEGA